MDYLGFAIRRFQSSKMFLPNVLLKRAAKKIGATNRVAQSHGSYIYSHPRRIEESKAY